ncbi:MAG: flagellar filament capping protein FliD [Pseudomonadota bacterium]
MALAGTGGNLIIQDGSPRLTGSFSGLDTNALVEAAVSVKRLPAVRLENKITENDAQNAAYGELVTLLDTFEGTLNGLRNPPGISSVASNIFEQKTAFLSADSTTEPATLLGVTADNSAASATYEIEILQIATAHKVAGSAVADASAALGVTETLTVGLAGAAVEDTVDLDITADLTANDVVAQINAVSETTGVRASVIQVAEDDFRVVVSAEQTNQEVSLVGTSGATTAGLGLSADNGATYTDVLELAQPAQLILDGIGTTIERDSNEISDILPGVTIDLFKAEPGTTITVEIEPDLSAVRQQILDFVEAYNQVKLFLNAQQEINSEGEVSEAALLFGDNTLRSLNFNLGTDLASLVDNVADGALATLRDIGIEIGNDNLLSVDESTLDSVLVDRLDEVRGALGFSFTSDSADVAQVSRTEKLDLGDFTINVPAGAIDGTNLQVDGAAAFEVDGNTLRGIEGTAYEGLVLAYSRDTSDAGAPAATINISTSLGVAERLFQTIRDHTNPEDGLITEARERLDAQNSDFAAEIDDIDQRLVLFREAQIAKYARLEEVLAQGQAIADQLSAFLNSGNDN